ncbi:MAG TPA: amino acid adenylation domain-containing protein, partial [Thermoanaerobaculia bacterium]|nr:amino acid adenylation domain-containing protein [Thermoanaerobaculia bacterium]
LAREEALRPFDLGRGPLLRATLLRLAEPRHLLLLTLHHIVADGWSMGILVRELGELYGAAASGRPAVLPELPVAYADFAVWQREWLAGGALDEPLAWWRERLAGAPAVLDLPLDRPRPAAPAFRGAHLPFRLPAELSRALSSFGRARGATPFIVLLSIFSALLSRLSGEEDLVVGSPVANRERPEVSGLIGFFVNTLALRADLSGDPTFGAFLERVRVGTMEALAHQDVPFERLVEELAPERDLRHTPLFQVMLALQSAPVEPLTLPGLALEPLLFASDSAKFDLTLALTETAEGLSGGFEYATDLFDRVTVERLAAAYGRLLGAAVERPESRLSELPLLSGAERHQALVEWNDTASGYPRQSLHRLFEEQAAARPEAVAVVGEEGQLTYGELDRQAARIARRLRRLGVRGEARVGLCLERSAEMVAAVLGILKAGGAYLPLDPFQPRERQALLLSDAAPAAIVGARPLLAMLPGTALRLAVEDLVEGDGAEAAFDPAADREETGPEGLAYVLYTSGSTGVPKGVEVHHAAVARLVCDTGYAAFGPDEVFLQLAPMSFDAATLELWGPLLHGGRLVLFPPGPVSPAAVGAAVARHGVTTLWLTAGLFHLAVEEGLAGLGGLRQLLAGGDVLSPSHVERALAALPGVAVINGYGPTENTTFSCTHRLPGGWSGGTVPIGRPIANSPAYLLDRAMEPVPAGATGEIYVGGAGLARGYLRLPDRTGERFVPDPFATGEGGGARLYRTGDLARRLPDGTLRFLGRWDFQVKVRGFRVELGEVEAVVAACPGVEAVVVTAHPDPGGDRRLVAYVVARDAAVTPGELRQALQVRLPEAMIPARFVFLGALPLGANGKVDRRALPAPEENGEGEKGEAPRTALEARLAAIWRQLLGRAQLSRHDDFFALGGHSLLATRLLSRLRTDFAVELPLRQLFEQPTLAAQAALVAAARAAATAAIPPIPAIPGGDRAGFLPLSFAQERLWFLDRLEPGAATYNVAIAVRLHGPLDRRALAASLGEIVRRHEVLRTTFALAAGRPAQRIGPAVGFALLLADLSGLAEERREGETGRLAAAESARPFDLERGPLLRGLLVGLAPRRHEALFTFHHIVFDGWSVEVLVRELGALYPANIGGGGRPSPLPELPIQYADFAVWQRAQLQGERLAGELDYWREALAGLPALVLPTDRSRPPVRTSRSAIHPMRCPAALARAAAEMAQANGATLFMVLLASFVALLHRYSAQEDFAVGSPIANRTQREVEDLIGFFVNTLVLRSNIAGDAAGEAAGDPAFCDLLARMRQTALSAYAHQDLPFERLVEELAPERSLGQAPLFQVMFALTNRGTEPLTLPGLTLEAVPVETGRAKFDLMVTLADTAEGVTGSWEYDVDLFDRASVERMATAYERLLAAAVERPAARLSELPLLSDEERRQLINLWSVPAAPGKLYPLDRTIHALFLEQAARTPRAEALVLGEASRTYGDLALRAGRIARFLAGEGIGAGDRVAIFLEHSFAMVEAVLGVLISGAAYVPLDPEHPKGRLEFILADSGVRLALTTAALSDRLPEGTRIVRLDAQEEEIERATAELPAVDLQGAEAVAYVLYTSGSTGQPKGVKVRHRSLVNYVCWAREVYLQGEPLSFALYTSLAFDLTVTSLFTPLVS